MLQRARPFLQVGFLAAASVVLLATPSEPPPCARSHPSETLELNAVTTCGSSGRIAVTLAESSCAVGVDGGRAVGLPESGQVLFNASLSAGWILTGELDGGTADAGSDGGRVPSGPTRRDCTVQPSDGGFSVSCRDSFDCSTDGGSRRLCEDFRLLPGGACEGTLTF